MRAWICACGLFIACGGESSAAERASEAVSQRIDSVPAERVPMAAPQRIDRAALVGSWLVRGAAIGGPLTLASSGRYRSVTEGLEPGRQVIEIGAWSVDGDVLTLTPGSKQLRRRWRARR